MHKRFGLLAVGGLAVALVAGGGTALAASTSPVGPTGVITGCYTNAAINGSHAVVLQNGGTSCPNGTSAITWNQTGPAGPAGPAGATGATGAQGPAGPAGAAGPQGPAGSNGTDGTDGTDGTNVVTSPEAPTSSTCNAGDTDIDLANGEVYTCNTSGTEWNDTGSGVEGPPGANGTNGTGATVASLSSGNTNCPTGGASITDGSGNVAYVCNGAAGAQGPAGSPPDGYFCAGALELAGSAGSVDDAELVDQTGACYEPLAAGSYVVNASVVVNGSTLDGIEDVSCFAYNVTATPFTYPGPYSTVQVGYPNLSGENEVVTLPVSAEVQIPAGGGQIGMYCFVSDAGSSNTTTLVSEMTAVQVTDPS